MLLHNLTSFCTIGHQKTGLKWSSSKNWLKAEGEGEEKRLKKLLRHFFCTIGHQKTGVKLCCSKNWLKAEGEEEEKRLIDLIRPSYTIGHQKNGVK